MSKLSEEEIIKYIKDEIENETDTFHWFDNIPENKTRKQIEESINAHQGLLDLYNKEKEKNKELVEQNKNMKSLFNIQASIAKELDFNTNEKMVKLKDEYYVPDTMAINANIGEPKTIELRYISATKYLTKFDEEE